MARERTRGSAERAPREETNDTRTVHPEREEVCAAKREVEEVRDEREGERQHAREEGASEKKKRRNERRERRERENLALVSPLILSSPLAFVVEISSSRLQERALLGDLTARRRVPVGKTKRAQSLTCVLRVCVSNRARE